MTDKRRLTTYQPAARSGTVHDLITLPVRLPWLATRLGLRVGARLATVPLRVAERLIEAAAFAPAERREAAANRAVAPEVHVIDVMVAESPSISEPPLTRRQVSASDAPRTQSVAGARPSQPARPPRRRTDGPAQVPGGVKPRPEARRRRPTEAQRPKPADEAPASAATVASAPRALAAEAARDVPTETAPPRPAAEAAPAEPILPQHVATEEELVESFAESGAEDGVGATVHVEAPWEGYGQMAAKEVIARLADAGREEVAAVELYERAHRSRRTVLAAASRQLRLATAAARRPG